MAFNPDETHVRLRELSRDTGIIDDPTIGVRYDDMMDESLGGESAGVRPWKPSKRRRRGNTKRS